MEIIRGIEFAFLIRHLQFAAKLKNRERSRFDTGSARNRRPQGIHESDLAKEKSS